MEKNNALTNCYPEAKSVVVSGDIHGDFNELVYKLCIQYQMTDTLLIVAGSGWSWAFGGCTDWTHHHGPTTTPSSSWQASRIALVLWSFPPKLACNHRWSLISNAWYYGVLYGLLEKEIQPSASSVPVFGATWSPLYSLPYLICYQPII